MEVAYPDDFFISFASTEDCDKVLSYTGKVRCAGAPVAFRRWHRSAQASSGKLDFFCKLGIEGMPANAWEWGAVSQLVNNLQGQLVKILSQVDRRQIDVTAWMRNPSGIPKIYDLEIPEPVGLPNSFEPEAPLSPPMPPRRRGEHLSSLSLSMCWIWWTGQSRSWNSTRIMSLMTTRISLGAMTTPDPASEGGWMALGGALLPVRVCTPLVALVVSELLVTGGAGPMVC